jgi:tetratricopeptide (TPR) repeat protein
MIRKLLLGLFLLITTVANADIGDIAAINQLKREAETAFHNKFWNVAINKYKLLTEKYHVKEPAVLLNLAHAYFEANEMSMALMHYEQAAKTGNKVIQTIAYQQAALIKAQSGQLEEALKFLRNSLRSSPSNQTARYNYEVVYALWIKKQQQQGQDEESSSDQSQQNKKQQQQNADKQQQQQKGQQSKENAQTGEQDEQSSEQGKMEDKSSNSKLRSRKLEQIKMTEEQARTLLDAIRNNEVQYLQQMQRQPSRRIDRSKPDW